MLKIIDRKYIIPAIVTIFLILNSGYALYNIQNYGMYINIILSIISILPICQYYKKHKIDSFVLMFFSLIFMVVATYIVSGFNSTYVYIYYITSIIVGFGISIKYDFKNVVKVFLNIMTAVSVISLIGYFLINYTNLLSFLPIMNNNNDVTYAIGYIFNYITIIPERNCGIFWEPGLFATFLIVSIVLEVCFKESKPNFIKIILYIICILTTKSAAGYRITNYSFSNNIL